MADATSTAPGHPCSRSRADRGRCTSPATCRACSVATPLGAGWVPEVGFPPDSAPMNRSAPLVTSAGAADVAATTATPTTGRGSGLGLPGVGSCHGLLGHLGSFELGLVVATCLVAELCLVGTGLLPESASSSAAWLAARRAPSTGKSDAAAGRSLLSSSSRRPDPESWARYPGSPRDRRHEDDGHDGRLDVLEHLLPPFRDRDPGPGTERGIAIREVRHVPGPGPDRETRRVSSGWLSSPSARDRRRRPPR